jgi:hypothetical protein
VGALGLSGGVFARRPSSSGLTHGFPRRFTSAYVQNVRGSHGPVPSCRHPLPRLTRHSFAGVTLGTTLPLGNSLSHCEKWNKPRRFRAFPAFAMSHPRQLRLLTCNYPPTAQGVPLCLLSSEDSTSSVNVNCFASANPAVLTSIAQTLCHIYRRALESFYSRIGTCQ